MHIKMTHTARAELANAMRRRYQTATGREKHKFLDEFIATDRYCERVDGSCAPGGARKHSGG